MLREIDRDVWVAEQPLRYLGLSVGTRMTVIRLPDGKLAVISPIRITTEIAVELNEIGTIEHIIAPNLFHYLFAANCKKIYPQAIFWAAPGLEHKKIDLAIDRSIDITANSLCAGLEYIFFDGFRTLTFSGFVPLNECVFLHPASRTLILTDSALNFDESFPALTQLVSRSIGGYKSLRPSLLERIATTETDKIERSIEKILGWDFDRVIMAHGSIIEQNGKEKFKQGYEQFLGRSISLSS